MPVLSNHEQRATQKARSRPLARRRQPARQLDLRASEYSTPVLGLIFRANFAKSEGQGGGEFFTPRPVVKLMVEIIGPHGGKPPAPPSAPA